MRKSKFKTANLVIILWVSILIAGLNGEVQCIRKAINCNWEPVGKAEIIYTASACTGLGMIVGYIYIQDK